MPRSPPNLRNTSVFLHCTMSDNLPHETMDQRVYRDAFNKDVSVREIESLLSSLAVDCGLYDAEFESKRGGEIEMETSQGERYVHSSNPSNSENAPVCRISWGDPQKRNDESTLHPSVFKIRSDLVAHKVIKYLKEGEFFATFQELKEELSDDVLSLSMALTSLLSPEVSWRWTGNLHFVKRGLVYFLVPNILARSDSLRPRPVWGTCLGGLCGQTFHPNERV